MDRLTSRAPIVTVCFWYVGRSRKLLYFITIVTNLTFCCLLFVVVFFLGGGGIGRKQWNSFSKPYWNLYFPLQLAVPRLSSPNPIIIIVVNFILQTLRRSGCGLTWPLDVIIPRLSRFRYVWNYWSDFRRPLKDVLIDFERACSVLSQRLGSKKSFFHPKYVLTKVYHKKEE